MISASQSRKPLISICIPAYKRPDNIRRLLNSIAIQTFTDYEIIITDDSPDDSVRNVVNEFSGLPIVYHFNSPALHMPANWNFGISIAGGEWIKIMHDDDWFSEKNSLQLFADSTKAGELFIVSRYRNVFESGKVDIPDFPVSWQENVINNPVILLSNNVIGPPSVTLVHNSVKEEYDIHMRWRVDMDYYIRILLKLRSFKLVDKPLINVGISESQVTNSCINKPEVELPEGLLMLTKYGVSPLKDIRIYDAWWRILRNTGVRSKDELFKHGLNTLWPQVILKMVEHQSAIPKSLLTNGFVSKTSMIMSYMINKKNIK